MESSKIAFGTHISITIGANEMSTIPLTPQQIAHQEAQAAKEAWLHKTLVAFDQFMNVVTGGLPDETISARSERDAMKGEFLGKLLTMELDL